MPIVLGSGGSSSSVTERKRALWFPSGAGSGGGASAPSNIIDQSGDRMLLSTTQTATSGAMRVTGNLFAPAGTTVSNLLIYFASSSSGTTHSFAVLIDQALNVLGKSIDATTDALTVNVWKPYALTTPWVASVDTALGVGFVQTSTVTQVGLSVIPGTINSLMNQPPRMGFTTPGTTTVPGDVGSTITFNANANPFWAAIA